MTAVISVPDFLGKQSRNSSKSSIEAAIAYLEELLLSYDRIRFIAH